MSGLALQPGMLTSAAASGFNPLDPKWAGIGVFDMGTDVLNGSASPAAYNEPIAEWRNQITDGVLSDARQTTVGWQPIYLPRDENGTYAHLPGSNQNFLTTPDAAELDGFGDFTIEVEAAMQDWTPATDASLVTKYRSSSKSYLLQCRTSGKLRVLISTTGADDNAFQSSVATGLVDGSSAVIRVVRSGADVDFYVDSGSGFAKLGDTIPAISTPITNGTAALMVGAHETGNAGTWSGRVFRVGVWNNANPDGTSPVLDINIPVDAAEHGVASFTCSTGQTIAVNRSGWNPATIIGRNIGRTDGSDDFLQSEYSVPDTTGKIYYFVGTLTQYMPVGVIMAGQKDTDTNDYSNPTSMRIRLGRASEIATYYNGTSPLAASGAGNPTVGERFTTSLLTAATGVTGRYQGDPPVESLTDTTTLAADKLYVGGRRDGVGYATHQALDIEAIYEFPDPGTDPLREELRAGIESIYQTYF